MPVASGLWPQAAASESALCSLGAACDWLLQEEGVSGGRQEVSHPVAPAAALALPGQVAHGELHRVRHARASAMR